jgi:cell division protein FtsB
MEKMSNHKIKNFLKKPNSLFGFFFKNFINLLLSVIAIMMLWQITFKEDVCKNILHYKTLIQKQIEINQSLNTQNEQLIVELNAPKNEKNKILESQARYKLGMIKQGEVYYETHSKQ